jgi:hypothetical protein
MLDYAEIDRVLKVCAAHEDTARIREYAFALLRECKKKDENIAAWGKRWDFLRSDIRHAKRGTPAVDVLIELDQLEMRFPCHATSSPAPLSHEHSTGEPK